MLKIPEQSFSLVKLIRSHVILHNSHTQLLSSPHSLSFFLKPPPYLLPYDFELFHSQFHSSSPYWLFPKTIASYSTIKVTNRITLSPLYLHYASPRNSSQVFRTSSIAIFHLSTIHLNGAFQKNFLTFYSHLHPETPSFIDVYLPFLYSNIYNF